MTNQEEDCRKGSKKGNGQAGLETLSYQASIMA